MTRIEGEIVIGRPVDVVFDYVADQSNEPQYNPQMVMTAGSCGRPVVGEDRQEPARNHSFGLSSRYSRNTAGRPKTRECPS